jgi:SAM-dependent methyltransferase
MENPERFDPRDAGGTLIDSEHRARYHFGAQVVAGQEVLDASCGVGYGIEILSRAGASAVTGVDISAEAIAAAKDRFGEFATALEEADLRDLPFKDNSFDVVVSFETIEHVEEPREALAELDRVLRPGGILVISSPNPDGYIGGNEHHVHEFRPAELLEAVGALRANLMGFRQDARLGSVIHPFDGSNDDLEVLRTGSDDEEPPYCIVVASDQELPSLRGVVSIGGTFDVRWWSKQVENLSDQVLEANGREMRAIEREQKAGQRLQQTSEALLEANRELAHVPVLRYRLESLEELHNDLAQRYHELLDSTSWKVTAPLRRRSR